MATRKFTDFDPSFGRNPITNDLMTKSDNQAISFAIKNLIMTRNGERPFNSALGSPIRDLLFELFGDQTNIVLRRIIADTINNFEPRVTLIDVRVNESPDNNALSVMIQYQIKNTIQPYTMRVVLERTR